MIEAAENGKDVTILVELKARFDEENNIEWSSQLEDARMPRVIYGLDGYKVHSKLCLIRRRKKAESILYHTDPEQATYNEKTSRLYTDLSLMTANVDIALGSCGSFSGIIYGRDCGRNGSSASNSHCLQNKVIHMIDREIEHAKLENQLILD